MLRTVRLTGRSSLTFCCSLVSSKPETDARQSYSNNFGAALLARGPAAIEGVIIQIVVKPLVTRLNALEKYLLHTKNVTVYGECRAFLLYLKETHGSIFRSLIFSSLLDPQRKLQAQQSSEEKSVRIPHQEIKVTTKLFAFSAALLFRS